MYESIDTLSEHLKAAHESSWQRISEPGAFWDAQQRVAIVEEARAALECDVCTARKAALSPNAIVGPHDAATQLPTAAIDAIHRLRTDPGRITHAWFEQITAELQAEAYVELVSVVNSSVIIDTLHRALDLAPPELPRPAPGAPNFERNPDATDIGAWVPVLAADTEMADTGLPQVPNIARSLGLVPSAVQLFFNTFRPHYALKDIDLSISQAQAEFVASRTSAINECFY